MFDRVLNTPLDSNLLWCKSCQFFEVLTSYIKKTQLNNYKDTDCTEQVIAGDGLMEFA